MSPRLFVKEVQSSIFGGLFRIENESSYFSCDMLGLSANIKNQPNTRKKWPSEAIFYGKWVTHEATNISLKGGL